MFRHLAYLGLILSGGSDRILAQSVFDVPESYPSIQAAIDASSDGDTVLVSPGSYLEHVDFLGKAVELRSSDGPMVTTICGRGSGPVVFAEGVSGACSVQGFSIEGGFAGPSLGLGLAGGISAVNCEAVTVTDCVIRDCVGGGTVAGAGFAGPGGLLMFSSHYLIENCTIESNLGGDTVDAPNSRGGSGGCDLIGGSGSIRYCHIGDNQGGRGAPVSGSTRGGTGGLEVESSFDSVLVFGCSIEGNRGGLVASSGPSTNGGVGGLRANGARIRVERCSITANIGATDGPGGGVAGAGGIELRVDGSPSSPPSDLVGCLIAGNVGGDIANGAPGTGGTGGAGGLLVDNGRALVTNCTIVDNFGGTRGAGGVAVAATEATLTNCLIWGNDGGGLNRDHIEVLLGDPPVVTFSDVEESWPGEGNLDVDPMFTDSLNGDYSLACGSPLIDQGIVDAPAQSVTDLPGNPRAIGDAVDLGAYEFVPEVFPTYCASLVNSSGFAAEIGAFGCHSIATDELTLSVAGLPDTPGLFFYGPNQVQVTFGDGFRCVGGAVRRMPPMPGMGARFQQRLDLGALGVVAGTTSNFQFWFRDPSAGGAVRSPRRSEGPGPRVGLPIRRAPGSGMCVADAVQEVAIVRRGDHRARDTPRSLPRGRAWSRGRGRLLARP